MSARRCDVSHETIGTWRKHGTAASGPISLKTRGNTPQPNGTVGRLRGRLGADVCGITIDSHADPEQLLVGFNRA